jgi:hypothetical protein
MLQPKGREGSSMGWKEWARNEPEEDMGESRRGLRLLLLIIIAHQLFTFPIIIFNSAFNPVARIRITFMRILFLTLMRIQILAFHNTK